MIREWRLFLSERTPWFCGAALLVFTLISVSNGARWTQALREETTRFQAEDSERIHQMDAERAAIERGQAEGGAWDNPADAAVVLMFVPRAATLPPLSSGFLSIGQSDVQPSRYFVSGKDRVSILHDDETDTLENPANLLWRGFDPAFVAVVIVPLFLVATSASLLARDRERGMASLLFVQSGYRTNWWWKRAAARYLWVLGIFALALFAGMGISGVDFTRAWPGALVGLLLVAAYLLFWQFLVLWFSQRSGTASQAILSGLTAWFLLVLALPAVAEVVLKSLLPVPPRHLLLDAQRDQMRELNQQGGNLLMAHYEKNPQDQPPGFTPEPGPGKFLMFFSALHEEVEARNADLVDAHLAASWNQQRRADWLSFGSPAIALQRALDRLGGSSQSRHLDLAEQAGDFRRAMRQHLQPLAYAAKPLEEKHYAAMPSFQFRETHTPARALFFLLPLGLALGLASLPALLRGPKS